MSEMDDLKEQVEALKHRITALERHCDIGQEFENAEDVNREFQQMMFAVDNRSLQQVFRNMDVRDLPTAFIGLPDEIMDKVRRCFSVNQWNLDIKHSMEETIKWWSRDTESNPIAIVVGEAVVAARVQESIIVDKRRKILKTVSKLERMGEIVVARAQGLDGVEIVV